MHQSACVSLISLMLSLDGLLEKRSEKLVSVVEFSVDDSLLVRRICGGMKTEGPVNLGLTTANVF